MGMKELIAWYERELSDTQEKLRAAQTEIGYLQWRLTEYSEGTSYSLKSNNYFSWQPGQGIDFQDQVLYGGNSDLDYIA